MTRPDPARRRVPGAHLDGTPSTTTVTTTPDRQRVVIMMHGKHPTTLVISRPDAAALLTLLCAGRDGMVALVGLTARIYVVPTLAEGGQAGDTDAGSGATMLLVAGAAALAAARLPCAGPGSVAVLHTSAQIDDLVAGLADVLSGVEPPADP